MTKEEYFQFLLKEQRKMVEQAYRKDPQGTQYAFYGFYGKIIWTADVGGRWAYEVQSPGSKRS